jgi:alanine-glyoxylate transaminase/serine-glyoxylate transaminase/serine-pyruvate transaminase
VPEGIDEAAMRSFLLQQYSLEIGAGLGPMAGKVWRIGLMGESCQPRNIFLCLNALAHGLAAQGKPADAAAAVAAASAVLAG